MAAKDKYVAYVSSYTSGLGTKCGIRTYDVDLENGKVDLDHESADIAAVINAINESGFEASYM